jgi:N utilization substance protein B
MIRMFRQTLALGAEHEKMIGDVAPNWDTDRIALMDLVLMKMALAEARTFESIPVKVTLNEYLELSRYYSTDKSNVFINGVLDQLFSDMQANKKIKKVGRGLIQ